MSKAIKQIGNSYVGLGNRQKLEDLLMHRHELAADLKMESGFDFRLPIGQIEEEIAAIEEGIARLLRRRD
jgi:hypothetical protein